MGSDFRHRLHAGEDHVGAQVLFHDGQQLLDTGLALHRKGIDEGAAEQHAIGAQGQHAEHVGAGAHTAIGEDGHLPFHRFGDRGQRLRAGHGAVQLAAAVVRDHDAVGAQLQRVARVVRVEDALDDQLALPLVADPLQVLPGDAGVEVLAQPADVVGQASGVAPIGGDVAEIVGAAVQADVPGPARVQHRLQHTAPGAVGAAHAAVEVAVAVTGDGHVDREDQVARAQLPSAAHHVAHEGAVFQDVELEPDRLGGLGGDFGQGADRDGRLDEGDVAVAGSAYCLHLAAAGIHAGQADRGQRDREVVALAEPFGADVELGGAAQDALAQLDRLQVVNVGAQGLLGAGAAVEIMEQEGRQLTAGCFAKVCG